MIICWIILKYQFQQNPPIPECCTLALCQWLYCLAWQSGSSPIYVASSSPRNLSTNLLMCVYGFSETNSETNPTYLLPFPLCTYTSIWYILVYVSYYTFSFSPETFVLANSNESYLINYIYTYYLG